LIDQGEELFLAEGQQEAEILPSPCCATWLPLMPPAVIVLFTIRSDNYERLQLAKELEGLRQQTLHASDAQGFHAEVIKGPGTAAGRNTPRAQDRRRAGGCAAC